MEAGEDRSRPSEDCSRPSKRPRLDRVDLPETGGGQETVGCWLLQFQQAWDSVLHSGEVRPMNKFVVKQRFMMETVQDVKELLRPGDYGATVDLQDAFYHVSVANRSRRYPRFIMDNTIYKFRVLPMGLTCSPRIFTGINRVLGTLFRRRGISHLLH